MKISKITVVLFLAALCFLFSGCYTLRQGFTYLGYLCRAIPLERVDDEDFVQLVHDIRRFAIEELGLAMSRNYTRYVKLDRDYLAVIVSASARDSFQRHDWRFPIVGSLPYKGFFNVEDARREQARLEGRDLDVWLRRVGGFSTLGWFRDPLFSFMRYYSSARLADLIIHELVHATVWIRGDIQFNEGLATFIGIEGARLFIIDRYGEDSDEYRDLLISNKESAIFVASIQELIAELEILYSSGLDRETILKEKELIINNAQRRFEEEYDNWFVTDNFRGFSSMPINNAYLELFRLYHTPDNFFEDLFERSGRDLPAFVAAAKTVTRRGGNPREQLERALLP